MTQPYCSMSQSNSTVGRIFVIIVSPLPGKYNMGRILIFNIIDPVSIPQVSYGSQAMPLGESQTKK